MWLENWTFFGLRRNGCSNAEETVRIYSSFGMGGKMIDHTCRVLIFFKYEVSYIMLFVEWIVTLFLDVILLQNPSSQAWMVSPKRVLHFICWPNDRANLSVQFRTTMLQLSQSFQIVQSINFQALMWYHHKLEKHSKTLHPKKKIQTRVSFSHIFLICCISWKK